MKEEDLMVFGCPYGVRLLLGDSYSSRLQLIHTSQQVGSALLERCLMIRETKVTHLKTGG